MLGDRAAYPSSEFPISKSVLVDEQRPRAPSFDLYSKHPHCPRPRFTRWNGRHAARRTSEWRPGAMGVFCIKVEKVRVPEHGTRAANGALAEQRYRSTVLWYRSTVLGSRARCSGCSDTRARYLGTRAPCSGTRAPCSGTRARCSGTVLRYRSKGPVAEHRLLLGYAARSPSTVLRYPSTVT